MSITELSNQYNFLLAERGYELKGRYGEAPSIEVVQKKLAGIGFDFPELVQFFAWCDGLDYSKKVPKGLVCFLPGYYKLGLDETIDWYQRQHVSGQFDLDHLPLFCADGYDFYHFNRKNGKNEIIGMIESRGKSPRWRISGLLTGGRTRAACCGRQCYLAGQFSQIKKYA